MLKNKFYLKNSSIPAIGISTGGGNCEVYWTLIKGNKFFPGAVDLYASIRPVANKSKSGMPLFKEISESKNINNDVYFFTFSKKEEKKLK